MGSLDAVLRGVEMFPKAASLCSVCKFTSKGKIYVLFPSADLDLLLYCPDILDAELDPVTNF